MEGIDNPFLARPDEHKEGAANELYCWMPGSSDRECNGSCIAYEPKLLEQTGGPCLALEALCRATAVFQRAHQQAAVRERVQSQMLAAEKLPSPPEVK